MFSAYSSTSQVEHCTTVWKQCSSSCAVVLIDSAPFTKGNCQTRQSLRSACACSVFSSCKPAEHNTATELRTSRVGTATRQASNSCNRLLATGCLQHLRICMHAACSSAVSQQHMHALRQMQQQARSTSMSSAKLKEVAAL
jgi:diaminopimelate decarboxylase